VLFDGEAALRAALVQAVAEAPDGLPPLDLLLCAFRKAGRILEENRPFSEPRLAVIAVTPALRERELAKAASLTEAVAEALRRREVADRPAALAAHAGWGAFHQAAQAWIDDPSQSLDAHLSQAFDDLRALSAPVLPTKASPEN
jgi:MftR C-terminal domain